MLLRCSRRHYRSRQPMQILHRAVYSRQSRGTSEPAQLHFSTTGFFARQRMLDRIQSLDRRDVSGQNVRGERRVFVMPLTRAAGVAHCHWNPF